MIIFSDSHFGYRYVVEIKLEKKVHKIYIFF